MPRCAVFCGLVVDDQARLGRDAPFETGDDQERRAPFDLGIRRDRPGRRPALASDRMAVRGSACERAWLASAIATAIRKPRVAAWASCETRSFQVGTVSSQSWARRWSRAWRMTADCKKPSRPDGVAASSSTAARRPVSARDAWPRCAAPPSGCPAPIGGRRARSRSRSSTTTPSRASSQPSEISFSPERRADHPQAHAGQGPDEPAERQPGPEPRVPEASRDLFQCSSQFRAHVGQSLRAD